MFEPTPIYKLLMYADHQRQIPYGLLLHWAAEFGVHIPDTARRRGERRHVLIGLGLFLVEDPE